MTCAREYRAAIAALIIDLEYQIMVDDMNGAYTAFGRAFNAGADYAMSRVSALLHKILDGTIEDNDFDEAEYAAIRALCQDDTLFDILKAAHDVENERRRAQWRKAAAHEGEGST